MTCLVFAAALVGATLSPGAAAAPRWSSNGVVDELRIESSGQVRGRIGSTVCSGSSAGRFRISPYIEEEQRAFIFAILLASQKEGLTARVYFDPAECQSGVAVLTGAQLRQIGSSP